MDDAPPREQRRGWQMPDRPTLETPEPVYRSWADYLDQTTYAQRMKRCHAASKRANRVHVCQWTAKVSKKHLFYEYFTERVKGECALCGALPRTKCLNTFRLKGAGIWAIIEKAEGRCMYCNSLAVENRPSSKTNGAPLPWAQVGRRIGSLEHIGQFLDGRKNQPFNLGWSCLWCNTWPKERQQAALDHGGYYPELR